MREREGSERGGRWGRRLLLAAFGGPLLLQQVLILSLELVVGALAVWRTPVLQSRLMVELLSRETRKTPLTPSEPSLSPEATTRLATRVRELRSPEALFDLTNVWSAHLEVSSNQWNKLQPLAVPPLPRIVQPDGTVALLNPRASRNGLAGVLGIDLPWSSADLDFGDMRFVDVAVRYKGNGTFITGKRSYKRPFKVDLDRRVTGHALAGRTTLNLHNLVADASCLSDTMAYEFFRKAGVPTSRTAFARLCLTVDGRFQRRLLGLYLLVENPDEEWALDQFGVEDVALFKPVTYDLFKDLGNEWSNYARVYDPKTTVGPEQQQRIMDLARLVTHADRNEFAERIGQFIDLGEFAKFLACEALLSNYDGILSTGQNYLLYLDPRTDLIGFVPWDLDLSWGEYPMAGTVDEREGANLWRPWVGENRFLARMLSVGAVLSRYREELRRLRETVFVPERLSSRMDELAAIIRPFVAEESSERLGRFEAAVAGRPDVPQANSEVRKRQGYQFSHKRFFRNRAVSVDSQLNGTGSGVVINRGKMF